MIKKLHVLVSNLVYKISKFHSVNTLKTEDSMDPLVNPLIKYLK
jgi:hypothetical protein